MTPCKRSKAGQNICTPETRPTDVRSDALLAAAHELRVAAGRTINIIESWKQGRSDKYAVIRCGLFLDECAAKFDAANTPVDQREASGPTCGSDK